MDPDILDTVGILELVHQHIGKALAVMVEDMRLIQPQLVGAQQQLGEVYPSRRDRNPPDKPDRCATRLVYTGLL